MPYLDPPWSYTIRRCKWLLRIRENCQILQPSIQCLFCTIWQPEKRGTAETVVQHLLYLLLRYWRYKLAKSILLGTPFLEEVNKPSTDETIDPSSWICFPIPSGRGNNERRLCLGIQSPYVLETSLWVLNLHTWPPPYDTPKHNKYSTKPVPNRHILEKHI